MTWLLWMQFTLISVCPWPTPHPAMVSTPYAFVHVFADQQPCEQEAKRRMGEEMVVERGCTHTVTWRFWCAPEIGTS